MLALVHSHMTDYRPIEYGWIEMMSTISRLGPYKLTTCNALHSFLFLGDLGNYLRNMVEPQGAMGSAL